MENALDGFPAAVLLDDRLTVDDKAGAVDRRAQELLEHVLTQWATTIEGDLERFPPATIEVVRTLRERMARRAGCIVACEVAAAAIERLGAIERRFE